MNTPWKRETAEQVALRKSILDQTEASLWLAKHVIDAGARESNFVFSPLSIHVLLGMVASGSNGPTLDQILDFLKSKSLDDLHALFSDCVSRVLADGSPVGGPVLSTGNGLWVDGSLILKPGFRNIVENVYKSVSEHVDFKNKADEVIEEVNAWAKRETKGVIKKVVSKESVSSSTRLIWANALYFKGACMGAVIGRENGWSSWLIIHSFFLSEKKLLLLFSSLATCLIPFLAIDRSHPFIYVKNIIYGVISLDSNISIYYYTADGDQYLIV